MVALLRDTFALAWAQEFQAVGVALAMLTMKAQFSLGNAEKYFKEHLQVGDYYMEGQQVMGEWMGQGAESLGLTGATHTDEFVSLCRNLHPATGERLTQRHNGKRVTVDGDGKVHELANRRYSLISRCHRPSRFPLRH